MNQHEHGSGVSNTGGGFDLHRLFRLALKETREILRDRRTILTLLLMPLLVYPLLSVAFRQFFVSTVPVETEKVIRVAVTSERHGEVARQFLRLQLTDGKPKQKENSASSSSSSSRPKFMLFEAENLEEAVLKREVQIALRFHETPDPRNPRRILIDQLEVIYLEDYPEALEALALILEATVSGNEERWQELFKVILKQPPPEVTIRPQLTPLQEEKSKKNFSLAALIPLILLLTTITGAVYPAIDLTAGERERGTMEMLVAAPLPRFGLLFAKYVAVLTVALLTAMVNLTAMTVTLHLTGMAPILFGQQGLTALTVIQVFGLLILFASFFSAVLLTITSFARSFKEAQAYLIPLMLASLTPGVLSLLPGLELSGWLTVTPLVNIALLARDLFEGEARIGTSFVVVLSTLLYAFAALGLASRVFGVESVLYGSSTGWGDMFRRPSGPTPTATLSGAMLCLALVFAGYFAVSGLLSQTDAGLEVRLLFSGLTSLLVFMGFPLVGLYLGRVVPRSGLQLTLPRWSAWPAAILLGLSLWPWLHELVLVQAKLGLSTLTAARLQQGRSVIEQLQQVSPVLLVAALALAPACSEELFFRGYLFTALRTHRKGMALVVSSVAFGIFHLVLTDSLAVERLIPSFLLGLILALFASKFRSLWPGILLHLLHNGTLILLARYQPQLAELGIGASDDEHLPALWLAISSVGILVGGGILWWSRKEEGLASRAA